MWPLLHPVVKPAAANFAESGQGKVSVTQLWQDNVRLINALSQVNWADAEANFQFEVCETCGYPGCAPGGWVALRRAGAMALILPAFQKIAQASRGLENDYLPPRYLHNGIGWRDRSIYEETLIDLVPCPEFQQLPQLTAWEAAKLLQWEAPQQILGDIYIRPTLPSDLVIASSEGSFLEQVPIFTELFNQFLGAIDSVIVQPLQTGAQVICFYLDLAGIPQWNALVRDGDAYSLYLEPGYVLVISD